ncbi:hypothetical protein [Stenotrophomonas maltophilia]|uniref:hypothetical protein n=1 Tax=Stenotrophomonas maltophilia TaxID=40324 RepID=UPI00166B2108|nr:hypothetical protein [Stenotrophomonas maltophilia]
MQQQDIVDCVMENTADSINRRMWLVQRLKRDRPAGALIVDDSPSAGGYAAALPGVQGHEAWEAADCSAKRGLTPRLRPSPTVDNVCGSGQSSLAGRQEARAWTDSKKQLN